MRLAWFVGWSAFVGILWIVLAASFADDEYCTEICFTFGDMMIFLAGPAVFVWALGLSVRYIVGRNARA